MSSFLLYKTLRHLCHCLNNKKSITKIKPPLCSGGFMKMILKLFQKSHIRTHKIPHIRDTISDHHETIESKSKCKTTIYLRVESSLAYHTRMYQACSHEFYPARSLAYLASYSITERTREIYLDSWLDKREVSRPHAYRDLFPEYIWEHRLDRELEMTDPDSLVYDNSLYLIECIVMSSIDILIAEYSTRDDCSDWCIFISHYEILHTRRLCCENISFAFEPKCILHISCWVCFWYVNSIEVEILSCHLHRVIDIKSHADKCILHFSLYESNWVEASFFSQKRYGHILLFTF